MTEENAIELIRKYLLAAPDSQLDACIKPDIEKAKTLEDWTQIREHVVYSSLGSDFVVVVLSTLIDGLEKEV